MQVCSDFERDMYDNLNNVYQLCQIYLQDYNRSLSLHKLVKRASF